jgi:glycosyltransferase involved in cell wall biosynthesis
MDVSVVLPAYNSQKTLQRSIESVLSQKKDQMELLVIDDGSTDGTSGIARKYKKHLRYIGQKNRGVGVARNRGIRLSKGRLIAFIDSDDEWLPGKLKYQWELFQEKADLVFTGTGANYLDKNGRLLKILSREREGRLLPQLLLGNFIVTSSVMLRKAVLNGLGPPFLPSLRYGEDYVLWSRLAARHEFYMSPRVYVNYAAGDDSQFLGKYSEKDIVLAYETLGAKIGKYCRPLDIGKIRSRMHFELASVHARRNNFGKMLAETLTGLKSNPWGAGSGSWCVKNFLRYLKSF